MNAPFINETYSIAPIVATIFPTTPVTPVATLSTITTVTPITTLATVTPLVPGFDTPLVAAIAFNRRTITIAATCITADNRAGCSTYRTAYNGSAAPPDIVTDRRTCGSPDSPANGSTSAWIIRACSQQQQ